MRTLSIDVTQPCVGKGCSYLTHSINNLCGQAGSSYAPLTIEYPGGSWWTIRYLAAPVVIESTMGQVKFTKPKFPWEYPDANT